MKFWTLAIASSALTLGSALAQQTDAGTPLGVLFGFKLVAEPTPDQQTQTGDHAQPGDSLKIISRSHQSEAESPFQTAWIQISGDAVKVRWLQDAIVPRESGFWRFGENTDSVRTSRGLIREDFFWAAPLGEIPKLAGVDHPEECDGETRMKIHEVDYIGPNFVARSTAGSSMSNDCFTFRSSSVASLDQPNGKQMLMSQVLGPTVRQKLEQLNRQARTWKPKEGEDCGQDGWEADARWWTLTHAKGQWRAFAQLLARGGGTLCRAISQYRALDVALPPSLLHSNNLPIAWTEIKAAFPEATDTFASPGGAVVLVVAPGKILLVRPQPGKLDPFYSIPIPNAVPVMAEWALGENVARWDQTVSKLPGPSPSAKPRANWMLKKQIPD